MKRVPAPLAIAILLVPLAACGDDAGQNPQPTPITVTVGDDLYSPTTVTVPTGTTVNWNWTGIALHDLLWVAPNSPTGAPLQTTGTYQRVFNATGTFEYYCSLHGTPTSGMRGTIIIR